MTERPIRRRAVMGVVALLTALAVVAPPAATAATPDREDAVESFRRDVFVVVGSTLRNPDDSTDPAEPLFNVTGIGLGVTWGEWTAASASAVAHEWEHPTARTSIRLRLDGLVPGGVYSVFYGTIGPDSENPLCPGVERTLALRSIDEDQAPDASSFVAADDGSARFRAQVDGTLVESHTQVFYSVIYHADGETYGDLPNRGEYFTQGDSCRSSFGHDAMRQLLVLQKW